MIWDTLFKKSQTAPQKSTAPQHTSGSKSKTRGVKRVSKGSSKGGVSPNVEKQGLKTKAKKVGAVTPSAAADDRNGGGTTK